MFDGACVSAHALCAPDSQGRGRPMKAHAVRRRGGEGVLLLAWQQSTYCGTLEEVTTQLEYKR